MSQLVDDAIGLSLLIWFFIGMTFVLNVIFKKSDSYDGNGPEIFQCIITYGLSSFFICWVIFLFLFFIDPKTAGLGYWFLDVVMVFVAVSIGGSFDNRGEKLHELGADTKDIIIGWIFRIMSLPFYIWATVLLIIAVNYSCSDPLDPSQLPFYKE